MHVCVCVCVCMHMLDEGWWDIYVNYVQLAAKRKLVSKCTDSRLKKCTVITHNYSLAVIESQGGMNEGQTT